MASLLKYIYPMASIALLIALWSAFSDHQNSSLFPGPESVLRFLSLEIHNGNLPYHLGITMKRLVISFFLSMLLGTVAGITLGRSLVLNRILDVWLVFFLNLPALVTIILVYLWFGLTEFSAILAVIINKVPNVTVSIREGTKAMNPDFFEMAKIFRITKTRILFYIVGPQLAPYLLAAARSGLGLIWKIILVVELLGRSNGVGYQLHLFFQMFDVAGILAYSLAFIVIAQLTEWMLLRPLERFAYRWKA